MENHELIDAVLNQDKETFAAAFQSAIASKVTDALEVKKVEIASTLIVPEVEVGTDELETTEAEIDGSVESATE